MFFSYISRLFKQLSKSRWIQLYFALVSIQIALSISILLKTLINAQRLGSSNLETDDPADLGSGKPLFGNGLAAKGYKIVYENVLFIAFEVWRLWTLTDGIVHLNIRTILASAWFSVVSSIFSVMLAVESNKWNMSVFNQLKVENKHLQISLTVTLFVLSIPTIISAYKTAKIIGWQVYKKIGSSIELQNMYRNVQWLALCLKIDIYFEVFLLICTAIITTRAVFQAICIIMTFLVSFSLVLSRIAVTRESNLMMGLCLSVQIMVLACNIYSLIGLSQYTGVELWYTGILYEIASMICAVTTIYLAVRCQVNFGRGLKSFVFWMPFQGTKRYIEGPPHHAIEVGLLGMKSNEDRLPIDDEDEVGSYYSQSGTSETKYVYTHLEQSQDVHRISLERVHNNIYNTTGSDSIKLVDTQSAIPPATTTTMRLAVTLVPKNSDPESANTMMNIAPVPIQQWTGDSNHDESAKVEPIVVRRVLQQVSEPLVTATNSNNPAAATTTTTTTTTTTIITTIRP